MTRASDADPTPPAHYVLGGLRLTSALRFASLNEVAPTGTSDLSLRVTREGPAPRPERWLVERLRAGEPYLQVWGTPDRYLLAHAQGLELEVVSGTDIRIRHLEPHLDPRDLEHLLLDQLLPQVIGRLGRLSLHGSAIAWGDAAVALLAQSGTGKSTFAAAATRRGATFLADDQVVLEPVAGGFVAHASYPFARLCSDAARRLFGAVSDPSRKHYAAVAMSDRALPLDTIVLLERGDDVVIESLGRRDAVPAIGEHVDRLDPTDRDLLRAELHLLVRLVESARVVRLRTATDWSRLDEAIDLLRAHVTGG